MVTTVSRAAISYEALRLSWGEKPRRCHTGGGSVTRHRGSSDYGGRRPPHGLRRLLRVLKRLVQDRCASPRLVIMSYSTRGLSRVELLKRRSQRCS
ncbi:hypothetical protein E2C01_094370 [Portunus trituberculatus]|uniref:Uncharacterized protein n=1 Tax=Portunus trituberculatus TaxID=210409 RepID=A0A5B7K1H0_PORTR|nr:hypothetical protein [Portunus trituberculatus]